MKSTLEQTEILNQNIPAKALDERGRCCGRKPMVYKNRDYGTDGFLFCPRCDRAYDRDDKGQISNWAYKENKDGTFTCQLSGGPK